MVEIDAYQPRVFDKTSIVVVAKRTREAAIIEIIGFEAFCLSLISDGAKLFGTFLRFVADEVAVGIEQSE